MKKYFLSATLVIFHLFLVNSVAATPKIIKNVRIKIGREKQYFNIFQSTTEPSLWYSGQTKPSVLIRNTGSVEIPEISIIRFQKKDLKNPQDLVQGAHFKMHLSLGPSDETTELLLQKLKKKVPQSSIKKPLVLSPVPFGALKLYLQRPDGKEVELKAETLSGISSKNSSQNVAFSTELGILDTDLLEALMRGNTGAKYTLYYNYNYVDPVLSKEPANLGGQRDFSTGRDLGGSSNTGSRTLSGSRDFNRIAQDEAEKSGWEIAGMGFIGFAKYPKSIRDMCVFVEEDSTQWQNAYLSLPVITKLGQIEIDKIELDVALIYSKKAYSNQKLTWTPKKGWRDHYGAPIVYGVFDLTKINQQKDLDFNLAYFSLNQRIESNGKDVLIGKSTCQIMPGDSPISDPLNLAEVLEFQLGFLSWSKDPKNGLQRIEVALTEGDWNATRTIEMKKENGKLVTPTVAQWLVREGKGDETSPLIAQVFFVTTKDSKEIKIPWSLNGKDLRKELFALSEIFFDKDWSQK